MHYKACNGQFTLIGKQSALGQREQYNLQTELRQNERFFFPFHLASNLILTFQSNDFGQFRLVWCRIVQLLYTFNYYFDIIFFERMMMILKSLRIEIRLNKMLCDFRMVVLMPEVYFSYELVSQKAFPSPLQK